MPEQSNAIGVRLPAVIERFALPSQQDDPKFCLVAWTNPDTGYLYKRFETERDCDSFRCIYRNAVRRYLRGVSTLIPPIIPVDYARQSAERLSQNLSSFEWPSFANPLFCRDLRRRLIGQTVASLRKAPPDEISYYSIGSPHWRLPSAEIAAFSARSLRERFRKLLCRYGGLDRLSGWCIISFHLEYDPTDDCWQPHFHIVVIGQKALAFEKLRDHKLFSGGKDSGFYRPIVRQELNNIVRQTAYLYKFYCLARPSYIHADTGGRRRVATRRELPTLNQVQSLSFYDRQRFSDLVWLHGVSIADGRLVPS